MLVLIAGGRSEARGLGEINKDMKRIVFRMGPRSSAANGIVMDWLGIGVPCDWDCGRRDGPQCGPACNQLVTDSNRTVSIRSMGVDLGLSLREGVIVPLFPESGALARRTACADQSVTTHNLHVSLTRAMSGTPLQVSAAP